MIVNLMAQMFGRIALIIIMFCCPGLTKAQSGSLLGGLPGNSVKYLETVSSKADKYYSRITSKTEKTLEKLARWEEKIKNLLEKTSPETAQRLFGNGQLSFALLLQKYKEGKVAADGYRAQYNQYRDTVTTTLNYLNTQKRELDQNVLKPLNDAKGKVDKLNSELENTEALQRFIKERKKQLLEQTVQYIGKSKYLQKISKESYYYVETLRNLKETFSDPKKVEQKTLELLGKTKFFKDFMRKNSMLASLFRMPGDPNDPANAASLAGLQTRVQVNGLIQQQIAAGGPNAQQQFQQNIQAAQSQLNELKNKVLRAGGGSSDADPEGFKPNNQRSKTFWQKWELGLNVQTNRSNGLLPVASDLGISAGFRPHDKFVAGVGIAGRIGWGKDISHINISYQGVSGRFFTEYKLKGSFHVVAGFEMNYRSMNGMLLTLPPAGVPGGQERSSGRGLWQKSGLVGVSKTVSIKSKFFKKTKASLMWDVLSYQQVPKTQPLVFRITYYLK